MKTKTSYVKQKTKKFKLTLEFDVNAKDREEAERILKSIAQIIIKSTNGHRLYYNGLK